MVCKKCEKKVGTLLAAPDKWKDGAKNVKGKKWGLCLEEREYSPLFVLLVGQEGRKINQNKLLSKSAKMRQVVNDEQGINGRKELTPTL